MKISKEKQGLAYMVMSASILNGIIFSFSDPHYFLGIPKIIEVIIISAISYLISIFIYSLFLNCK